MGLNMNNKNQTKWRVVGLTVGGLAILLALSLMIFAVLSLDDGSEPPIDDKTPPVTTASPKENSGGMLEKKPDSPEIDADEDALAPTDDGEVELPTDVKPTTEDNRSNDAKAPESASVTPTFVAPLDGSVTKSHADDLLVYSVTMNDYRVHLGVDIAAELGEAVTASADGVVESVVEEPFMGYTVTLSHGGGFKTSYKNLAEILPDGVVAGQKVSAGDVIGAVGESALVEIADAPHLHFEVIKDGVKVDPLEYVTFDGAVDYVE